MRSSATTTIGNNDWNNDSDASVFPLRNRWKGDGVEVLNALTAGGIKVLMNEAAPLQRGSDRLWLVGCDDFLAGDFDLDRALASLPLTDEPRFLLMHNPQPIELIAHHGFDLVLSGHTHGGQISLPFVPPEGREQVSRWAFLCRCVAALCLSRARGHRRSNPIYDHSRNCVLPPYPFLRRTVNSRLIPQRNTITNPRIIGGLKDTHGSKSHLPTADLSGCFRAIDHPYNFPPLNACQSLQNRHTRSQPVIKHRLPFSCLKMY